MLDKNRKDLNKCGLEIRSNLVLAINVYIPDVNFL